MRRRGTSAAHFKPGDRGPADALERATENKQCANCEALHTDLKAVVEAVRYLMKVREIKCHHNHPPPDSVCAKCQMDKAIDLPGVRKVLEGVKDGE